MREVKFKGVDENNKIYDLLGINWENMTGLCQVEDVRGWSWCRFKEFIQYTGLKDKNGKEIYEGDIVRAIAEERYAENTRISDVIFGDDSQWQVRIRDGYSHGLPLTWGGWESIGVIGNIFEKPELLKSSS